MTPVMTTAITKGAKQIVAEARGFLSKLAGPAAEEAGLLFQDRVKLLRFQNQLKILQRAQQMLRNSGLTPSAVPFRTLAPILEGAALEDDPVLSEKWACLLANAGAKADSLAKHPAFPRILAEMTPGEAFFLDRLSHEGGKANWAKFREAIAQHFSISHEQVNGYYGNLFRLGVCQIIAGPVAKGSDIKLGAFGLLFMKACSPPTPQGH